MSKLSQDDLNMIVAHSLALSTLLVEKFEIMKENGMFVQRAKQSISTSISALDEYIYKTFDKTIDDDFTPQELSRGAAIVSDFVVRLETVLINPDLLTLSQREEGMWKFINETALFPVQKEELMKKILESRILNY